MKLCKVRIIKNIEGNMCKNEYPSGYNSSIMDILCYEEKKWKQGINIGFCIALVPDDFQFTSKMVEISKEEAEAFVNERGNQINGVELQSKFKRGRLDKIAEGLTTIKKINN